MKSFGGVLAQIEIGKAFHVHSIARMVSLQNWCANSKSITVSSLPYVMLSMDKKFYTKCTRLTSTRTFFT